MDSLATIIAASPLVDRLLRDHLARLDVTQLTPAARALLLAWLARMTEVGE